eukprot:TRINITY_DN6438_c0_g1_i1.p1 TRINITY_DN6438_c0_g1~~TRINITY_DN6438_c0_g1_i1.p1  ORF type:complete len:397 (+),score=115.62 TRINITY_DN6438_c0_g1_i1:180-1370(+)
MPEASLASQEWKVPTRAIFNASDVHKFSTSRTYADYLGFVRKCGEAVKAKGISSGQYPVSPAVEKIEGMLGEMEGWVAEYPPLKQPMRFGNKAFCSWHSRLVNEAPRMMAALLPKALAEAGAARELLPYLCSSFGHEQRIDYGTGHETQFAVWLCCLVKIGVMAEEDLPALVLRCFMGYLRVMRLLHKSYVLEPAGSHGVWGLDDYHCLPFVWGAAQLIDHASLTPLSVTNEETLVEFSDDWMYIGALKFAWDLKSGAPFAECCPMLNDISALPSWKKVYSGMLKLYEGEVLQKLPVVQHFLFGSLLPATWQQPGSAEAHKPPPIPPPASPSFDPYIDAQAPWAGEQAELQELELPASAMGSEALAHMAQTMRLGPAVGGGVYSRANLNASSKCWT